MTGRRREQDSGGRGAQGDVRDKNADARSPRTTPVTKTNIVPKTMFTNTTVSRPGAVDKNKCGKCARSKEKGAMLRCIMCDRWFHQKCGNVSQGDYQYYNQHPDSWTH